MTPSVADEVTSGWARVTPLSYCLRDSSVVNSFGGPAVAFVYFSTNPTTYSVFDKDGRVTHGRVTHGTLPPELDDPNNPQPALDYVQAIWRMT